MGRHSCCYKQKLRKGLWSPEEDEKLLAHITSYGHGCWSSVPKQAGLLRCGKSCRLRWINYLRPDLKRGAFSEHEENLIVELHKVLGNRWSQIAAQLPGRTDNEIKNLWNSSLKKKLKQSGIDPATHKPLSEVENGELNATKPNSNESTRVHSNKEFFNEGFVSSRNETPNPSDLMGYYPFQQLNYAPPGNIDTTLWFDQTTKSINPYDTNTVYIAPSPIDLNSSSTSFHSQSSSINSSFDVSGCRFWDDQYLMENQTQEQQQQQQGLYSEIKSETQFESSTNSIINDAWAHHHNNQQQQQLMNWWNI